LFADARWLAADNISFGYSREYGKQFWRMNVSYKKGRAGV
jgi:hypothetical protein